MKTARFNIYLPEDVREYFSKLKNKSAFVAEALRKQIKKEGTKK